MPGSLHQAGRSLARSPGYAAAVVLTLALGIVVAVAAVYLPARRATRVSPMELLRAE
jgi:ABC-type lipoprotein release transport system permease subunit